NDICLSLRSQYLAPRFHCWLHPPSPVVGAMAIIPVVVGRPVMLLPPPMAMPMPLRWATAMRHLSPMATPLPSPTGMMITTTGITRATDTPATVTAADTPTPVMATAVGAIVAGAAIGLLGLPITQVIGGFEAIALPTTAVLDALVELDALGLAVAGAFDGANVRGLGKPASTDHASGSGLTARALFPERVAPREL